MTADLRARIRHAIDAKARARRQTRIDNGELHVCAGCQRDLDLSGTTQGCKSCDDRTRSTQRRTDPHYNATEAARAQTRRATRTARQRERRKKARA